MPTVIKAGEAGPVLKRLSTVDLADHLAEADAVVKAARRRGESLVAEADGQAEGIRTRARDSGYEAGYKQGYEEGMRAGRDAAYQDATEGFDREHAAIVADMRRAVTEIGAFKEDLCVAAEADLLDFAVRLAGKLTVAIGESHRGAVVENFKRALRLVASKTALVVRVHPDDVASLETFASSVLRETEASTGVKIVADESIKPGGCIVENDRSRVDATLETQIDEMVALLLGRETTGGAQTA